jgi:hypothetical protein
MPVILLREYEEERLNPDIKVFPFNVRRSKQPEE